MYEVGDRLIVVQEPSSSNKCHLRKGAIWFVDAAKAGGKYLVRSEAHKHRKHTVSAGGWLDCFRLYKPDNNVNTPSKFEFITSQNLDIDEVFSGVCRANPIGIATCDDHAIVGLHASYIEADSSLEDSEFFLGSSKKNCIYTFGMPIERLNAFLAGVRRINRSTGRARTYKVSITK